MEKSNRLKINQEEMKNLTRQAGQRGVIGKVLSSQFSVLSKQTCDLTPNPGLL